MKILSLEKLKNIKLVDIINPKIVRFIWRTREPNICPLCESLDGKVMNSNDPDFMTYQPPLHPRCFIDGRITIYTDSGWKYIKNIKIGDLVLTHRGRFKRVTNIFREKKYSGEIVKIYWNGYGNKLQVFSITPEHKLLINNEWKEAKDVKGGDSLKILSHKCKRFECNEEVPFYKDFCSQSCNSKDITKRQWSNIEHRKNMSIKLSEQRKKDYILGIRDKKRITEKANKKMRGLVETGEWSRMLSEQFKSGQRKNWSSGLTKETDNRIRRKSEYMKINNPSNNPEIRKKMTETYKETIKQFPEKHPNFIMAKKGFISSLEKKFMDYLDNLGIEYKHQYPIDKYWADFVIEKEKICIECDGDYWHKNKEKDLKRQKEIENLGWTVLRFSQEDILFNPKIVESKLINILSNHNELFNFMDMKILSVERKKLLKPKTLYDFEVEEDNSFVAKGIISHNCKCHWENITSDSEKIPDVNWLKPAKDLITKYAPFWFLLPSKKKEEVMELPPFAPESPNPLFNKDDILDIEWLNIENTRQRMKDMEQEISKVFYVVFFLGSKGQTVLMKEVEQNQLLDFTTQEEDLIKKKSVFYLITDGNDLVEEQIEKQFSLKKR